MKISLTEHLPFFDSFSKLPENISKIENNIKNLFKSPSGQYFWSIKWDVRDFRSQTLPEQA